MRRWMDLVSSSSFCKYAKEVLTVNWLFVEEINRAFHSLHIYSGSCI